MRYLILILSLFLVSCATPKTEPQSFYGGVYVPGKAEIEKSGSFTSTAGVFSNSNLSTARKAAFARFMLKAKNKGYRYFEIRREKTSNGIGKTFKLTGKALKSPKYNGRTYKISSIKNVLNGKRLVAIVRPAPPKKKKIYRKKKKVVAQKKRAVTKKKPAVKVEAADEPTQDPIVIMAPVDITGSVRKSAGKNINGASNTTGTATEYEVPNAVSDIPTGVVFRN